MTSDFSGFPAACASTDAHTTHLIQYTAFTPDDGEQTGIATVTAIGDRVPFTELAKIPGFIEADVIREHDGDPRPLLLGPGTDAPGHAAWCHIHDDEMGDGSTVCHGETIEVGDDEDEGAGVLSASLVVSTGEAPRVFLEHDTQNSVSLSAAREYALAVLAMVEQAEAGSVVTA